MTETIIESMPSVLSERIHMPEIGSVVLWASGSWDKINALWSLARSEDRRVSANALWAMTHLPAANAAHLASLRNEMIDMLLVESDSCRKRLLLQLLRNQDYDPDDMRTDFLDFCMSKINSESEPYAIRCFSIYAAYKMCIHFPELIAELEAHLNMMEYQALSPGLKSALRQTRTKINRLRNNGRNQNRRDKADA